MLNGEEYLFIIHQFVAALLCLFFLYYAWKDQVAKTFNPVRKISKGVIFSLLTGIFLGLFFLFLHEWGSGLIVLSLTYALFISLLLFDPKFAVAFFIFLLISRPWEFFHNEVMNSMLRDVFIIVVASFLVHKVIRKQFFFSWNFANTMLFFFTCWTFFSILPSGNSARGLEEFGEIFIKNIVIYYLIVNVVDKKEFIFPIQAALVLGITEKAFVSFYRSMVLGDLAEGARLKSFGILENSNDIAAIMILSIPFALVFLNVIKNKFLKYSLSLLIVVFYSYLIWLSKSRGAILGMGALIAAFFWLKASNKKIASVVLVVSLFLSMGVMSLIKRDEADISGSTNNRKIYWEAGIRMGIKNPIFGIGYGSYNNKLLEYTDGFVGSEGANKTAHSAWILALAETGIMGFIFYMAVWVYAFRSAWRMRFVHPEYILAMIAYGTTISFLSHTYILYPYILLGIVVASGQLYRKDHVKVTSYGLMGALHKRGLI
ncbi:MAG: O-antigen ligase family protein [Bacteriovorax sp.]|nr:O-antigen ligase family protein [Bacteriovorax sp.]